jgi:MFS family permease
MAIAEAAFSFATRLVAIVEPVLAWQAPGYETLILARLLTGLAHGVFFSIGSTIATSLVANKGAKGNAGHQRDRQAAEHNGDSRGCFLFCHRLA